MWERSKVYGWECVESFQRGRKDARENERTRMKRKTKEGMRQKFEGTVKGLRM